MPDQLTGRALDAWLAEHAMGWVKITAGPHKEMRMRGTPLGSLPNLSVTKWSPSTDPRAAFELVEAMRARGFHFEPDFAPELPYYEVLFYRSDVRDDCHRQFSRADTPCEAIALAAHAALGGS